MRLSNRSFPHPVVGNADDVPDAEFQVTYEFTSDRTNFYLTALARCSSRTLVEAVKKGAACYTLHVECGNTLFRRAYDFATPEYRVTIPAALVHDTVEVNAFVRAKATIPRYAVDGAHADYGGATFPVGPGDVLAVADGQTFEAENTVDPLRRVGALMVVKKSGDAGDHDMRAEFNADKIEIELCDADFQDYNVMKVVPLLTNHLTTTLVLPVLIEAIHLLGDEADPVTDYKWAKRLATRLDAEGFGASATALEKAQKLLGSPIRRALASAKSYADATSS